MAAGACWATNDRWVIAEGAECSYDASKSLSLSCDTKIHHLSVTKAHQWCKKVPATMFSEYCVLIAQPCTLKVTIFTIIFFYPVLYVLLFGACQNHPIQQMTCWKDGCPWECVIIYCRSDEVRLNYGKSVLQKTARCRKVNEKEKLSSTQL